MLRSRSFSVFAAVFLLLWIFSAIHPVEMGVWLLENVLVLLIVGWLIFSYRVLPLSNLSYFLIALFLLMHEVGAHYTYEMVPFGFWIRPWFGFTRNNYDRIVHFCFGFMLFLPCYESLQRFLIERRWLIWMAPVMLITAFSAFYEIAEAYANLVLAPYTAAAYLSLQGDPFDSQNDMAMALAGSFLAMPIIQIVKRRGSALWNT